MSIVVPDWFVTAKGHLTNLVLTGQTQTISSAGNTLTDDVSVTLTGRLSSFGVTVSPTKAQISSITSPRQNMVVIDDGFSVHLDVLKVNGGVNVDVLRRMIATFTGTGAALGYDYFSLSWVEGLVTGQIDTIKLYGSRGEYQSNIQGKGEVIASLGLDCVDPGQADFFKIVRS